MKKAKFGKDTRILAGILGVLLVILALVTGVKSCQRNHADAEAETFSAQDAEAEKSELTFDFDAFEYAKAYPELSREFCDNSMPNKAAERVAGSGFSDALSTPFSVTHGTKDGEKYSEDEVAIMITEDNQEVLTNYVYTQSWIKIFSNITLSDGTTLPQINPWLNEAQLEYDRFMKDGTGGQNYLREEGGKLYINDRQLKLGVATLWLRDRLINQGVQLVTTNHHYPLSLANSNSAKLTTFTEADYEFTRDALVLAYVNKAGTEVFKFGINVHDKRPELIKVKITEKKKKVKESEQETKVQETTQPETETQTEPETKSIIVPRPRRDGGGGGNNHHESQPEKKPSQDPVNNGGAKIGGGNTTVGTDAFEPTDPAVRTDGGHEKPADVKPETPAPDKNRNIKESEAAYENRMNYATETQPQSAEYRDKNGAKVDDIDIAGGNDVLDEVQ
mgnify:FL=1